MEAQLIESDALRIFRQPLQSIEQTIVVDTAIGSQVIISPVYLNGVITHLVISGLMLDKQIKKTFDYSDKELVVDAQEIDWVNKKFEYIFV